jgi:hypothetical protein
VAGAQIGTDETATLVPVLDTDFALERIIVKSPKSRRPTPIVSGLMPGALWLFVLVQIKPYVRPAATADALYAF